ncbi:MAG TPA: ABC transporter ATP-binding protein [Candidatus Eisenbacteria bacterium]|nr:ABC transporter ATP-binding protein [Candidatus Eisenbacteria bacterium]
MSIYRRLLGYLAPYRLRLLAAILCMVVYAMTTTVSLSLVSPFMQVLFERPGQGQVQGLPGAAPSDPARTLARAQEPMRLDNLAHWPAILRARIERSILHVRPLVALERICLFILVVLFLKNLADYFQSYLVLLVEQAAIRDLRNDLQRQLQRLSLSFFHARRTGSLISRVTNDVEYLRNALASGVSTMGKDLLTLIGALGLAFYASWRMTLLALLVIPAAGLLLGRIGRTMRRRSTRTQERMGDLTAILQESITGARVVRAFGTEAFEVEKFQRANQAFYQSFVRMRRIALAARPFSEFALVLVAVAMLWYGGREIFVNHSLAPHQFVLFVTALLTTISPTKSLAEVSANVQQGIAAAARLFELMDTKPDVEDRPGARSLPALRDRIRYEGVSFAYSEGPRVLHDLSFEIRRGEVVALVGSSGSGKSTAMDLLPRFYDPAAGRITLDGVDLREVTLASLRAQLGIVTQETILFHDTVRNNIAYGLVEAGDDAIRAAATAAHAHAFVTALPQGYDTVIGERGVKLSGGERQRLAIARALLKNPPLLLLDEATSALDLESERLVQEALERLMRDRTVLVIAHRLSTVQHADRIVVLEKGRVVATGTHDELLDQQGLYRRLYDLQFVA